MSPAAFMFLEILEMMDSKIVSTGLFSQRSIADG
jgi:hypothetical protein